MLFFAFSIMPLLALPAAAQTTYAWTNNTANAMTPWTTTSNWSGGVVPLSSSNTVITYSSTQNMTSVDDIVDLHLNRLVAGGGGAAGTKSLTISGSAGGTIEFVANNGVLPTLVFQRTSTGGMSMSLPFIVTDALTITSSGSASAGISGTIANNAGITLTGPSGGSISGKISGAGGITNQGFWTLSSNLNAFTGDVNINNNGNLTISATGALGAGANVNLGVAGTSSGTLRYSGATGTINKNINALGNGGDTINNTGAGTLTLSGTLTKANTVLTLTGGNFLVSGQITGGVSGSGTFNSDLVISGSGTTTLTNANNNYVGPTYVSGGATLKNGVLNALPTSTMLALGGVDDSAGTYDLGGFNQTLSGISNTGTGAAVVTNSAAGTGTNTLVINNDSSTSNAHYTFGGAIQNGATAVVAITKSGNQNLTLTGSNTYTGATLVGNGRLIIAGSLGNTAVTVGDGTVATLAPTLSGNGKIAGSVTTQVNGSNIAHIAPGVNTVGTNFGVAGTLQLSNGLTLGTGTNLDYDMAGTAAGTSDLITLGNSTLTIGSSITFNYSLLTPATLETGNSYTLISGASNTLSLSGITINSTGLGGYTANYTVSGGTLLVTFSTGGGATPTTYTLSSSAGNTNVLVNHTTTITSTITNTGSGTADTLNYTGLGGTATGGSITGASTSGTSLAQGASGSNTGLTYTAGATSGTFAVTPTITGSATNATAGGPATASGTTPVTVHVYDAASLSASSSGTNIVATNATGPDRASAKVTSDGGLSNNQGFTNTTVTGGTQIDPGSGVNVAGFDKTGRLNGTYTATKTLNFNDVTTSGSAIAGGSGDSAAINLTVTVSGQTAAAGVTFSAPVLAGQKYGTTIASGSSGGYGLTSNTSGSGSHPGTTATLINGTATANTTVEMTFNTVPQAGSGHDNAFRTSDILTLAGMAGPGGTGHDNSTLTDNYVLQLSYDPGATGAQYIGWYDATAGQWVNAIAGNSNSTLPGNYYGTGEYLGSYASYLATLSGENQTDLTFQLGAFGYDSATSTAWAVLNHESEFAVIPEPGTWGMILSGFGMLAGVRKLRRRRTGILS